MFFSRKVLPFDQPTLTLLVKPNNRKVVLALVVSRKFHEKYKSVISTTIRKR